MRKVAVLTVALLTVAMLGGVVAGEKGKEVTVEGTVMCAMCTLKEADWKECQNVIQFKKGDETVNLYIVKNAVAEEFGHVCSGTKDATVTGTIAEKDGKKWITPSKMTPAKELGGKALDHLPPQSLEDVEAFFIRKTLRETNGDRTLSAEILGIDKSTLWRKIKRYNLDV